MWGWRGCLGEGGQGVKLCDIEGGWGGKWGAEKWDIGRHKRT